eukprot:COSAG02_NODE_7030_length_3220_cov_2.913810_2_plen_583_part_00
MPKRAQYARFSKAPLGGGADEVWRRPRGRAASSGVLRRVHCGVGAEWQQQYWGGMEPRRQLSRSYAPALSDNVGRTAASVQSSPQGRRFGFGSTHSPAVEDSPRSVNRASPYASRTARPASSSPYASPGSSVRGPPSPTPSAARSAAADESFHSAMAESPATGNASSFRAQDMNKIMEMLGKAMSRISEVDARCEDEHRARLQLEQRAAWAEEQLRVQMDASARTAEEAAARERGLVARVAELERGQQEMRDAVEALCDTVEWSATNESVASQLGALEKVIVEHVEGVQSTLRTDLTTRADAHEDLLNELAIQVENLPGAAHDMVDELRQAATGVLEDHSAALEVLNQQVATLEKASTKLEGELAGAQKYQREDLQQQLTDIGQKITAAEEVEVRRIKHVHEEVQSLGAQLGRTEAAHVSAMEDVALAVAASNRQCEDMRQFIDQTRSDLQVHSLSHKMALEDIHAKLQLVEDPSGYLDRLKSLTTGPNGQPGRKNASEIAHAIDFILERVTNLEHDRDASMSEQRDAEAVSQMVDAKLLAVASRLEAQQAAIDSLVGGQQLASVSTHQPTTWFMHVLRMPL